MLKKALKSGARAVALQAGRLIDSDSATIEINGKTMSGREFQKSGASVESPRRKAC